MFHVKRKGKKMVTSEKPLYHYIALKANSMRNCQNMEAIAEKKRKAYQAQGDNYNDMQARKESDHYYNQKNGRKHAIERACREHMPSGSGFDKGTEFDFDKSNDNRLVFNTSYHHMNGNGLYCGWTDHTVTVTPCFGGIDVKVSGRNYRDIKPYIAETFYTRLTETVDVNGETAI
jgi:hypothetical protein